MGLAAPPTISTEHMLLRILRLRLVLVQAFRLAGVVCSYLPFVFVLCFTTLGYAALVSLNTTHATVLRRVSGLFTSTLLYVLTVWSFMACVFSDPGSPMTWVRGCGVYVCRVTNTLSTINTAVTCKKRAFPCSSRATGSGGIAKNVTSSRYYVRKGDALIELARPDASL